MSEMIERVARALCAAESYDPDADRRLSPGYMGLTDIATATNEPSTYVRWRLYVPRARAAIEAMREPTEGCILAGARAGVDQLSYKANYWDRDAMDDQHKADWLNAARHCHAAVLDEALR